jgi:hypothetical protein
MIEEVPIAEGWIWSAKNIMDPCRGDEEFARWEEEGDRVQWFRSEAEVLRWLEQVELKHFEFIRLIRSFRYTSSVWRAAAAADEKKTSVGYRAYALKQAAIYRSLERNAITVFRDSSNLDILPNDSDFGNISHNVLLIKIKAFRHKILQNAGVVL